jgi:hypothetical protein
LRLQKRKRDAGLQAAFLELDYKLRMDKQAQAIQQLWDEGRAAGAQHRVAVHGACKPVLLTY